MSETGLSKADIELLAKFDSPTVCNVIELFDVRPRNAGYMNEHINACFPEMPPMIGYASTAQRRCDIAPGAGDAVVSLEQQIETFASLPGSAVLIYQDLDEPRVAATFGDMMCKSYKTFGATGIVTSGPGRDLDQVRDLEFPAFTNGAISSHGYGYNVAIDIPVSVGGLTVHPGALIYGDCNGITTIPKVIASEVAHACAEFAAAEAVVLDYLDQGGVTVKGFAEAHAVCREMQRELGERLSRR